MMRKVAAKLIRIIDYCEVHPIQLAAVFILAVAGLILAQVKWSTTSYLYVANHIFGYVSFAILMSIVIRKYLRNLGSGPYASEKEPKQGRK